MTIEPACPTCGRPMKFLVVEEADKASHFECFDCATQADVPTGTVAVPGAQRIEVGDYATEPDEGRVHH